MFKTLLALSCVLAIAFAGVVTLSPDNYDNIVNDPDKNVFVKFYARWCGHCTRMAPAWEELAKSQASNTDVVIAELDAAKHQELAQRNGVRGFPTIKLFTKNNKNGIQHQCARDVPSFENFLKTNAN